jgi:hypothetical protein
MKLKFFNPEQLDKNLKATIQKTGKLGFTIEAAKKLQLSTDKSIGIAENEDDSNDKNLYVVIYPEKKQGAFNINKAGDYFYVNIKALLENLKIDYISNVITFDIIEEKLDGETIYKFKRRDKSKKIIEN